MSFQHVHKYLWRDHSLHAQKNLVLTLTDNEAIAFVAFITTLLAYAETRAWHVEQQIFLRLTSPKLQLDVDQKRHLMSHGAAIGHLLRALHRKRKVQTNEIRPVSPAIGVIAIANLLVFVILALLFHGVCLEAWDFPWYNLEMRIDVSDTKIDQMLSETMLTWRIDSSKIVGTLTQKFETHVARVMVSPSNGRK